MTALSMVSLNTMLDGLDLDLKIGLILISKSRRELGVGWIG